MCHSRSYTYGDAKEVIMCRSRSYTYGDARKEGVLCRSGSYIYGDARKEGVLCRSRPYAYETEKLAFSAQALSPLLCRGSVDSGCTRD